MSIENGRIVTIADHRVCLMWDKDWVNFFNSAQKGLNEITKWLYNNSLSLNANKTHYLTLLILIRTHVKGLFPN